MSRRRTLEAIENDDYVSIGELVRLTGCRYSTLKFYTEEGLLPFEQEEQNLTRRFPRVAAIERLGQIRELRARGIPVPEIKNYLMDRNHITTREQSRSHMFKKSFWVPYEDSANYPTVTAAIAAISKYCDANGESYTFTGDNEVEINGDRYEIYRGYENGSRGNYGIKCTEK